MRFVILDEVDRLLDMDFEPEICKLVMHLEMLAKEVCQTLMFSATLPDTIQTLARDFMRNTYALVAIDLIGSANKCITQEFIEVCLCTCYCCTFSCSSL